MLWRALRRTGSAGIEPPRFPGKTGRRHGDAGPGRHAGWAGDTVEPPPLTPPKAAGPGPIRSLRRASIAARTSKRSACRIGGIGTGSIWLDGQGRLAIWQIFNNLNEPRIPDSFFAVSARAGAGQPVTRVLQTEGEGELRPVESLEYEGGYPIARLTFHDPALPVQVRMEAFNPMIPLGCGQFVDPLRDVPPHGARTRARRRPR